jgi:hypothetical protein
MRNRPIANHRPRIRLASILSIAFLMALTLGCSWFPFDSLPRPEYVPPEQLRELRVHIYPTNCSSYTLDPPPYTGYSYGAGTEVTITLRPIQGCAVGQWFNVDSYDGNVGKFTMDDNLVVQVNFVQGSSSPDSVNPSSSSSNVGESPISVHVSGVVLEPQRITIEPNQTKAFTAKLVSSSGQILPILEGTQISWRVNGGVGAIESSGLFRAGTKAGAYQNAVEITANYQGVTFTSSAEVLIASGPVQQVTLNPPSPTVYTGDSIPFSLAAFDAYGNPIPNPSVRWVAEFGEVDSSGRFTANRRPGTAQITAFVSDGKATVQTSRSINVREGYCVTNSRTSTWKLDWYALGNNRSRGAFLGTTSNAVNFNSDWGFGQVFQGRADHVMVIGKSMIVVQRQGPVLFKVGSDDGFKLYLNGEQVISHWEPRPYGETSRFINLNPGIYELELHYYELCITTN